VRLTPTFDPGAELTLESSRALRARTVEVVYSL
jgi:hypothetical protein